LTQSLQEVLEAPQVYDGKAADVWSCAVHLYIMLVGWYPFTDPREPKNFSRTACNIKRARYAFPSGLQISDDCKELIRLMFVRNPAKRITIPEIKEHRWYRKNLSREMAVCPWSCCVFLRSQCSAALLAMGLLGSESCGRNTWNIAAIWYLPHKL
jgi:serine/threonine protein kinase